MKLVSFEIERFRNILNSGEIPVDGSITCLIGKNESGKTNLLHALHAIRPAPIDRKFEAQQYPRSLLKGDQRSGAYGKAQPISAVFEITSDELEELESVFGKFVLSSREWTYKINYANEVSCYIEMDEGVACRSLAARHDLDVEESTLENLLKALDGITGFSESDDNGVTRSTEQAKRARVALSEAKNLYPVSVEASIFEHLKGLVPTFFYFDDYSELKGRTEIGPLIEALRNGTEATLGPDQRTALSLLQLGYASDALVNRNYETRSSEMEAIAADLTQMVQSYWHQNSYLRLAIDIESEEFEEDGNTRVRRFLQLRVEDSRHFFTNNLDVRSSGFRWFVSFLAAFSDFSQSPVVILLDEPALSLHARAQKDFLDFMERVLGDRHQVIYTTHSPFMIDPEYLNRVRVVEDLGPNEGTVVRTQLKSRDPDSLSPLHGALGFDIVQNIFDGPDNLVIEDLSDFTYLTVMSEVLRGEGRTTLSDRWRILPAGSAGNIPAAIALMGQELDVTVVIDGGNKPSAKLLALANEGLLDTSRIILLGKLLGLKRAEIEDVFDSHDYLNLYNGAMSSAVTLTALGRSSETIVSRISNKVGDFNRNAPSNWLLANRATVPLTFSRVTLQRFEDLIVAINATLTTPLEESEPEK